MISNSKPEIKDNEINSTFYQLSPLKFRHFFLLFVFLFLVGLIVNFSIGQKMESLLLTELKSSLPCPITYKKITNTLFFLPKVTIENVAISNQCLNGHDNLNIRKIIFSFQGISFYKPGLKFSIATNLKESTIESNLIVSWNTITIRVDNTKISLSEISNLFESFPKIKGMINIMLIMDINYRNKNLLPHNLNLVADSKEVILPPQNIKGFALPKMNLGKIFIKLSQTNDKIINLNQLNIGEKQLPISATAYGPITLNNNFLNSQISLQAEVAFSAQFLKDFSILTLVLNKYQKREDSYLFKLEGTLASPSISP